MSPLGREAAAEAAAVLIATTHNWASHRRLPRRVYVPVNLGAAGALVALARWSGATWDDLGLRADALGSGARTGLVAGTALAAALTAVWALPRGARLFDDPRIRSQGRRTLLREMLIRIPLGTALAEELAFRGALLALSARRRGWARSVAWTSALFGAWHVLPAMDSSPLFADTDTVDEAFPHRAVWPAVVVTAAGGAALAELRRRSGSIVGPVIAHAAANTTAVALARRHAAHSSSSFSGW